MLKEIEEEIKEFGELIKKYPDIIELYIGRALLYTKIKQYENAIKDYEKGCANYMCYDIMNVCKRNNLVKEAEELYTKKINKDKNNTINYMSRARFYISVGENEKALSDCETILKLSPKNKFFLEIKEALIKKLKLKQNKTEGIKKRSVFR